jgi:DNA-binding PadR family transcriptional regulator
MSDAYQPERFMRQKRGPAAPFFERGGIKFAIMKLLRERPRHGYDIIRAMEEHSRGLYSPSAGAIYPILQALEDQDMVVSTTVGGKRVYSVTETGLLFLEQHKEEAQRHQDRWEAHLASIAGDDDAWNAIREMREVVERMMGAVQAAAADPVKREEIGEVLETAAEKVGRIAAR